MKQIFISPYPETSVDYLSSYPTNTYERIRLGLARLLIKWGLKLTLNNGTTRYDTSAS